MFELLLERLLVSRLGRYIAGIDKQNLSVALWKGDIIIENAVLRPEAFAQLGIPIKLVFGKISRLKISVPWTKLARAPVEIELSGLFVSCTQLGFDSWSFSEASVISKLKEKLELHELKQLSRDDSILLPPEEQVKKKSYTERLTARILDNLRVTVKDIHLRFEYIQSPKNVVCGITLAGLECYTTNSNWEMVFLDRQQDGKSLESIYKYAVLRGLGVYISGESGKLVVNSESETAAFELMHGLIYSQDRQHYVLQPLNAEAKFTHFSDTSLHCDVILPEFHLILHQNQYQMGVRLGDYFAQYGNYLAKEEGKKKYRPFLPEEKTPRLMWQFAIGCIIKSIRQREQPGSNYFQVPKERLQQYHKTFTSIHYRLKMNREVSPVDLEKYHQVIYICKSSLLQEWTKEVRDKIEEKTRLEGERRSLLSYFWTKPIQPKLTAALEEIRKGDMLQGRISESTLGEFNFLLDSAVIQVQKYMKDSETQQEGATFRLHGLKFDYRQKELSNEIELSLSDLTLESWQPGTNTLICRKLTQEQLARVFISFQGFNKVIKANVETLELVYMKPVVSKLVAFFAIPNLQSSLKAAAWDKLQTLQDTYQDALQDMLQSGSKVISDITIGSPRVSIPLGQGESFGLSLGTIRIYNSPDDYEEDTHEHVLLDASSVEFHFTRANGKKYPIFPSAALSLKLGSLKPLYRLQKTKFMLTKYDEVPDTTLTGTLPPLVLQLSSKVYNRLLGLGNYVGVDPDAWDATLLDKRSIMKTAVLHGVLKRKGNGIHGWYSTFTVYSGAYLYFFNDPSQATATSYFYTKDCSVRDYTDGVPYGLSLENRYGSLTLAFDSSDSLFKWRSTLNTRISDLESTVQLGKTEENTAKLVCMIVTLYTAWDQGAASSRHHNPQHRNLLHSREFNSLVPAPNPRISL